MARRGSTKDPRLEPRQERGRDTVSFILDATDRLVDMQGIEKLAIRDVAKLAGASIGTLYRYYPTKEALIAAWAERLWTEGIANILAIAKRLHAERAPLAASIREIVGATVDLVARGSVVVGSDVGRVARYPRRLELVENATVVLSAMLAERREDGSVRDGDLRVRCMLVAAAIIEGGLVATVLAKEDVARGLVRAELADLAVRVLLDEGHPVR